MHLPSWTISSINQVATQVLRNPSNLRRIKFNTSSLRSVECIPSNLRRDKYDPENIRRIKCNPSNYRRIKLCTTSLRRIKRNPSNLRKSDCSLQTFEGFHIIYLNPNPKPKLKIWRISGDLSMVLRDYMQSSKPSKDYTQLTLTLNITLTLILDWLNVIIQTLEVLNYILQFFKGLFKILQTLLVVNRWVTITLHCV